MHYIINLSEEFPIKRFRHLLRDVSPPVVIFVTISLRQLSIYLTEAQAPKTHHFDEWEINFIGERGSQGS
jgi:hypothetical protein